MSKKFRIMTRSQRGQVLPLWVASVILCFMLMFLILNYGNQLRYQIRAQNAADSAANALVSIQSERFNLIMESLYGLNIEEYRARRLLDDLLLSMFGGGGCTLSATDYADTRFGHCGYVYGKVHDPFIRATTRYNNSVNMLEALSGQSTFANWQTDATSLLTYLKQNCNNSTESLTTYKLNGGDCAFNYTLAPNGISGRTNVHATSEDAESVLLPSLGRVSPTIADDTQASLWTPGQVDVVTCSVIPSIVPDFGPFHFSKFYAVGRAASTSAIIAQDWFQPGYLTDPSRTGPIGFLNKFQPTEDYVDLVANHDSSLCASGLNPSVCMPRPSGIAWYDVDFGGTASSADTLKNFFAAPVAGPELSVRVGWWGPISIRPFGGNPTLDATTCHP